jgi:hypothetical protein
LFRSHSRIHGGAADARKRIDLSAYIALLSRMQSAFYKRYEAFPLTKGQQVRQVGRLSLNDAAKGHEEARRIVGVSKN